MNIKFPIRVKEKLHNNPTTTNFFIYFNVHRKIHTYDRVLKNVESWKTLPDLDDFIPPWHQNGPFLWIGSQKSKYLLIFGNFPSEAVQASQCYFFEKILIELKRTNFDNFGARGDEIIKIKKFFDEKGLWRSLRPLRLLRLPRSKRL